MMTNPYSLLNPYNVFRRNSGGGLKRSKIVYAFPWIMCRKNLADLNNSASVVSRVLEYISSNLDGLRCQDQLGLGSCQKGLVVDLNGDQHFFPWGLSKLPFFPGYAEIGACSEVQKHKSSQQVRHLLAIVTIVTIITVITITIIIIIIIVTIITIIALVASKICLSRPSVCGQCSFGPGKGLTGLESKTLSLYP